MTLSELAGTAYLTKIVSAVNGVFREAIQANPDSKHNTGRFLAEAYFWDTVESIAKGRSAKAWEALYKNKVIEDIEHAPGEHQLADSPHFVVALKVSEPRRAFNADSLAHALQRKYKVPVPISKQMIEAAKIPTKSSNTFRIVEKGV